MSAADGGASPAWPVEISDLALLSNCRASALVDGQGCIRWLCWPRFDSSPLFSNLLDPQGGLWTLQPEGPTDSSRRYLSGTLVLRTTFRSPSGRAELTDALALGHGERGHDIGRSSPQLIIRHFAVTEGSLTLKGCLMPRGNFGAIQPVLRPDADRLAVDIDGDQLMLDGPPPTSIRRGRALWRIHLEAGQEVTFALGPSSALEAATAQQTRLALLTDTVLGWRSWSALHNGYHGAFRRQVQLSGLLLQGLTFAPTGAVIEAPTTSLPRRPDGVLNRDDRLVTLEHAAETTAAMAVSSCVTESKRSVSWLLSAALAPVEPPHPFLIGVFPLDGTDSAASDSGSGVAGWSGAAPVLLRSEGRERRSPHAVGGLLAAVQALDAPQAPLSDSQQTQLQAAVAGARHEPRPEHGDGARSAVMRWVALDVAAARPEWLGGSSRAHREAEAAEVGRQVRQQGWDPATRTFTAFHPTSGVEAASLLLSLCGLVDPREAAMVRTVERVSDALSAPCGLLYRNEAARGLEGPSIVCTYWLVRCLVAEGHLERAEALFEQTTAYGNDLGLLSEQTDPDTGQLLGNFPYAGSHAGLILAARDLHRGRCHLR